jgi:N-ethylmaleimide reductase
VPITGNGMMAMTADGKVVPYETPRALETGEVKQIV